MHGGIKSENVLLRAMKDEEPAVRYEAARNRRATEYVLLNALANEDSLMQRIAIERLTKQSDSDMNFSDLY